MVLKATSERRVDTLRPPFTNPYFEDTNDDIDTVGVAVDDDAYDGGTFLDRDYEVRGMRGVSIALENLAAVNTVTYTVQEATKDYDDLNAELVDADFVDVVNHTDVTLLALGKSVTYKLIRLTPEVTAVRLRARRGAAGLNALLRADVKSW